MSRETFDVVPHEGIGPVKLGMTRDEVDAALGEPGNGFTPDEQYWRSSAVHVCFDGNGRAEFIEVSAVEALQARLNDVPILEIDAEETLALLTALAPVNPDDRELGYTYEFPDLELAVWRPVLPEEGDALDPFGDPNGRSFATVGISVKGYRD